MEFEWDEAKAAANLAKHGVSFPDAIRVFRDMNAVEGIDRTMDYGEERFFAIGLVDGAILTVFYTERNETIRMITARPASRAEQRRYDQQRQI